MLCRLPSMSSMTYLACSSTVISLILKLPKSSTKSHNKPVCVTWPWFAVDNGLPLPPHHHAFFSSSKDFSSLSICSICLIRCCFLLTMDGSFVSGFHACNCWTSRSWSFSFVNFAVLSMRRRPVAGWLHSLSDRSLDEEAERERDRA